MGSRRSTVDDGDGAANLIELGDQYTATRYAVHMVWCSWALIAFAPITVSSRTLA